MSRVDHKQRETRTGRRAGFTLLELMIVVVLLGILTAIAVPGLQRWRAEARIRQGAYQVLTVARGAQYQAIREGAAFAMVYEQAVSGGHGTLQVYRGMTNRCTRANWLNALNTHGTAAEGLDMLAYNPSQGGATTADADRHVIQADVFFRNSATFETNFVLCYEPGGAVYTTRPGYATAGLPSSAAADLLLQPNDVIFDVRGDYNGAQLGITRRVVFPAGGQPRILQGRRI